MKLKLHLPGDSLDDSSPDAGDTEQMGKEDKQPEVKAGIKGITLKHAMDKGDGEAIEEAIRACMQEY